MTGIEIKTDYGFSKPNSVTECSECECELSDSYTQDCINHGYQPEMCLECDVKEAGRL